MTEYQETPALNEIEYPSLLDRIQSNAIDGIFIIMLMFVFSSQLDDNTADWIRAALFFGMFVLYEPLCTSLGATLGNYMKGIRVRKHDSPAKKINFLKALIRYSVKVLLGWISFLTMHSNAEKRAIHDMACGSIMIKKQA